MALVAKLLLCVKTKTKLIFMFLVCVCLPGTGTGILHDGDRPQLPAVDDGEVESEVREQVLLCVSVSVVLKQRRVQRGFATTRLLKLQPVDGEVCLCGKGLTTHEHFFKQLVPFSVSRWVRVRVWWQCVHGRSRGSSGPLVPVVWFMLPLVTLERPWSPWRLNPWSRKLLKPFIDDEIFQPLRWIHRVRPLDIVGPEMSWNVSLKIRGEFWPSAVSGRESASRPVHDPATAVPPHLMVKSVAGTKVR